MTKPKRASDNGALPPSAEERAYQHVRREILDGSYQPGERLREEALALQVGVSRTPVRGALQRLATEGLVEFRRYVGAVVRVLPMEEIEQVYQFRTVVESLAAELAAQRASEADIDRLEALSRKMDAIAQRDIPDLLEIARLNKDFHLTLLAAGGNVFVKRVAENLGDLNFMIRAYSRFSRASLMRSMGHHRELVQALRARNPLWARSVMVAHIEAGRSGNLQWSLSDALAAPPGAQPGAPPAERVAEAAK